MGTGKQYVFSCFLIRTVITFRRAFDFSFVQGAVKESAIETEAGAERYYSRGIGAKVMVTASWKFRAEVEVPAKKAARLLFRHLA